MSDYCPMWEAPKKPAAEDRAPLTPAEANAIDPRSFIGANPPADAPSAEDFAAIEGWVGCSRVYLTNEGRAALSRVLEAAKEAEAERIARNYRAMEKAREYCALAGDAQRLRARVEKLEGALREIERRVPPDYGGTHYEGCEEHHDWCAVLKQARAALSEEP